jgi:hypothetical protein
MANASVHEYIDAAIGNVTLERAQVKSARSIIAQFLVIRKGLDHRIPSEELSSTAATLTAGIWTAPDSLGHALQL